MQGILVLGSESSGTRMLTEFLVRAGCFGDYGHYQRLDSMEFFGLPDKIVIRRGLPHGRGCWPDLVEMADLMESSGYIVTPVVITRDKDFCVKSQLREGHEESEEAARANILKAYAWIHESLSLARVEPVLVQYEAFVSHMFVRESLASRLGVSVPYSMKFYNANDKYKQ